MSIKEKVEEKMKALKDRLEHINKIEGALEIDLTFKEDSELEEAVIDITVLFLEITDIENTLRTLSIPSEAKMKRIHDLENAINVYKRKIEVAEELIQEVHGEDKRFFVLSKRRDEKKQELRELVARWRDRLEEVDVKLEELIPSVVAFLE